MAVGNVFDGRLRGNRLRSGGDDLPRPASAAPAANTGLGLETLTRTIGQRLLLSSLPWLLYNASSQIVLAFMPSFFVDNGFPLARATSFSAVIAIGFVLGVQAGGLLLKRSAQPDLICYAALGGWGVAILALSSGTAPLLWVVLAGVLGGLPAAALVSLPAEVMRPESRSAGMGIFFTVYYLGCAVLPTGAGVLYDRAGGGRRAMDGSGSCVLEHPYPVRISPRHGKEPRLNPELR